MTLGMTLQSGAEVETWAHFFEGGLVREQFRLPQGVQVYPKAARVSGETVAVVLVESSRSKSDKSDLHLRWRTGS